MKITNLTRIKLILENEGVDVTTSESIPLKVIGSDDAGVIVASSNDADLKFRLAGVTDVTIGSTVTVNAVTGDVTVTEAAAAPAPSGKRAPGTGCRSAASFVR